MLALTGVEAYLVAEPERTLVCVRGEIDLASVDTLCEALRLAELRDRPAVVVDLAGVQFMDSLGLRALLSACARLERAGRRFAVCNPQQGVRTMLRLVDAERLIEVG